MRAYAIFLALIAGASLTSQAGAQTVSYYCECQQGFGPCGNDPPTAIPGGCVNSLGLKGFIGANGGSTSVGQDDLVLVSINLPPHQFLL